jgi:phage tail sheath gpL-like
MTISFDSVPSALRVPLVTAEFNSARANAGPAALRYRGLLIAQKHSSGTAAANSFIQVTNAAQVIPLCGRGSMAHRMALAWFAENKTTELWIGVLADDPAGVAAAGTITVTGTATADGTLSLYVGGQLVRVAVSSGNDATAVAAAIAAAIGATAGSSDLAVHATNTLGVVNVVANNKGECGNEIDIRVNYQASSEALPAGVSLAIVAMASGATNPVLTTLISTLGDTWLQVWVNPYTDATSLTAIEAELESRAGPMRMIDAVAISAKSGTFGTVAALGNSRNAKRVSIFRTNTSPTVPEEYAASMAALTTPAAQTDPARPFQTLASTWVKAPAELDRDTVEERNLLLYDGISTTKVSASGQVVVDRVITTFKTDSSGAASEAYLDLNTPLTLMYFRFTFNNRISSKYPRHKLADDGARLAPGQAIMTPGLGRAEAVGWFSEMEDLGLAEGKAQFKTDLVCERDVTNRNRLNWLISPDLINQFIVGAAQIQFIL